MGQVNEQSIHRYLKNIDYSSFVMFPLLEPAATSSKAFFAFFWLRPITLLKRQTRQAVRAIDQSILLRCL